MSLLTLLDKPKTTMQLHNEYQKENPIWTYYDVYQHLQRYYNLWLVMKHKKDGEVTWEKIKKDLQFENKSL